MSWDSLTLSTLAGFGLLILGLSQLRDLLQKATEIVHAWRELRSSLRPRPDEAAAPPPAEHSEPH